MSSHFLPRSLVLCPFIIHCAFFSQIFFFFFFLIQAPRNWAPARFCSLSNLAAIHLYNSSSNCLSENIDSTSDYPLAVSLHDAECLIVRLVVLTRNLLYCQFIGTLLSLYDFRKIEAHEKELLDVLLVILSFRFIKL